MKSVTEKAFVGFALFCIVIAIVVLFSLIINLFFDGATRLTYDFFTGVPSRFAEKAGIMPALLGSIYLMLLTALLAFPIGVGAAVFLEEYATRNFFTKFIELNIANLAAVPSVIYGILGLELFVRAFGFGRSLIAGALTLAALVLPIIIISSREAIRTVPKAIREGALALGATRWQVIRSQVIPQALPGILTGCILAFSRAIGETAPLVTLGALTYVAFSPDSLYSAFTALPIQSFNWISRPQEEFHANAAAAICVLLFILLSMNAVAIWLRIRFQRKGV